MYQAGIHQQKGQGPSRNRLLGDLRDRISILETAGPHLAGKPVQSRPPLPLGDAVLDAALPSGGIRRNALHEIRGDSYRDAAATSFCAALLARILKGNGNGERGGVLWCRRSHDDHRLGVLYGSGLATFGLRLEDIFFVTAPNDREVLWACEEGLKCGGLAAVVGEVDELDLTASRRLQLMAEENGIPALLVNGHREMNANDLGATVSITRWSVSSVETERDAGDYRPACSPLWHLRLERCRGAAPGSWLVEWNYETDSFSVASLLASGSRDADFGGKFGRESTLYAAG